MANCQAIPGKNKGEMMEDKVKNTTNEPQTNTATPVKKVMVDDTHKYTTVTADAYIGPGGAHHRYIINDKKSQVLGTINFQDGAIKESGVNGVMDENLLSILIDRLKGFQSGPYQCAENAVALSKCQSALVMLKDRTKKREVVGKEGTLKI